MPGPASTPDPQLRPKLRTIALRALLGTASAITIGLFLLLVTHLLAIHRHTFH